MKTRRIHHHATASREQGFSPFSSQRFTVPKKKVGRSPPSENEIYLEQRGVTLCLGYKSTRRRCRLEDGHGPSGAHVPGSPTHGEDSAADTSHEQGGGHAQQMVTYEDGEARCSGFPNDSHSYILARRLFKPSSSGAPEDGHTEARPVPTRGFADAHPRRGGAA